MRWRSLLPEGLVSWEGERMGKGENGKGGRGKEDEGGGRAGVGVEVVVVGSGEFRARLLLGEVVVFDFFELDHFGRMWGRFVGLAVLAVGVKGEAVTAALGVDDRLVCTGSRSSCCMLNFLQLGFFRCGKPRDAQVAKYFVLVRVP